MIMLRNTLFSIKNLIQNEGTVQDLQQQLESKKRENTYLTQRLSYVESDNFVEHEARGKLGLVQENEYPVFVVPPSEENNKSPIKKKDNWKKWKEVFRL